MHFVQSKRLGKSGEKLISDLLKFAGVECEENINVKDKNLFDLSCKINKKKFTIECKYDWYSEKSGNLAIEYFNPTSNKASGIDATSATLWGIVINDRDYKTIWLTSVANLKQFIKNNSPYKTMMKVGDGNASIYLYKTDKLLTIFHRVDNLDKEDVVKTITVILNKSKSKGTK